MNKQCFRVIFSKTLQRLVVVSELAKSEGKSTERNDFSISHVVAQLKPLTFSLFCALGFVAFSDSALAETLIIQADKSAPKNQQPIVLQTANGLPQVNIQTPNDKGLSHNKYSQFDVAEKGAILNNSRTNTQTQQAGLIQGNPYLARGEAKVILNEVNFNKPSVMKGYVEVAGKKADVIIANPSGLHCDGCGIINSDRATFTTGKPEIKNGQVDNFKVEAGKVKVRGKGLDNSRVDYTEIIARETEMNAGIWSKKETKVITGKNTVKRSENDKNLQIINTKQPLAEEAKPQFAIDVGELGGMYSGKIHLIGTENGVGVRNAGHIGASADTLQIDSQGRIVNTGTLNAAKPVTLTASNGIENKGKIENKQGDIKLNSTADIKQDGSIVARHGNIHKTASSQITQNGESVAKGSITYQAPKVRASTQSLIAAGVEVKDTAQGEVRSLETNSAQGKDITVSATTKAALQGKNIASGKINVQGSKIDLDNSHTSAYSVNVTAHQGHIQANNATLIADKTLSLSTPTELQTQQSYLKAEKITSHQGSLNTQNAVWEQTGTDELKLSVNDLLKNQGGTFKTQGDLTIHSQGVDNRQGQLISGRKLVIEAGLGKVDSSQGKIRSTATLTINSGELDNSQGAIQSEDDIRINTHGQALINHNTLSNEAGIVTLGKLDLNTGKLENQHGYLASRSGQILLATELNNHKGLIKSLNTLEITTPIIQNNGGIISAQSKANITATDINQVAGQLGADTLSINATRLNSEQNSLIAAGTANIQIADTFSNQQSRLNTLGDLTIRSQGLNNLLGAIQSITGHTSIDTQQAINNTQGNITSHVQLNLNTRHLENQQGTISAQSSEISVGSLINRLGALQSTEQLSLNAEQVENSNGTIYGGKSLTLSAFDSITQRAGKIGASVLEISTGILQSTENSVIAADKATFNVKNTLTNTESEISATEHLTIHSKAINNQDGLLLTEKGNLTMNSQAQQINNERGKIVSGDVLNINSGAFNNQQGLVQAHHTALLNTNHNNLQNDKGVITSGADLQLNTSSIDNDNGTISAHAIDAKFTELEQQQGKIIASEALNLNANGNIRSTQQSLLQAKNLTMTVSGQVDNQQSEIVAHNSATIHSHELNNRNGVIIAEEGHLDFNAQTQAVINEQGKISAGSTLTLNSGELNNLRGLVQSRQGMLINTHQGNLNNQQTQKNDAEESQQLGIISLGQLKVTTQQFLNQQGYVLSQQNQTINARTIENETGIISSLANQVLSINQSLHNNNGRVSGLQTQITSAAIENQAGVIQGGDLLDIQVSGNINNQFGQLKTDKQLDVTATSINNREGQIRAIDGTVALTSTEAIDNTQGYITAAQSSTIHTKDLNNQQGIVYNKQDTLTLNLQQGLDNQQGKVISQDNLALKSHTLTNHQGTLYAKNLANIQATSQIDNQQGGKIHGLGDIHLQTNELDNRGGEIRTQHSLILNATSEINNQKVNETGSLIESGNVLNISTAHLNNSHTTSSAEKMTQGILATTLTVTAQMLNNQQGKIHSRAQSELKISQQIDNRQGGITGDNAVHIEGKELRLDNQQGQLQAAGKLSISANEITTDGHIEGRDIELTQQQDFITGNAIHANNTLSITTAGNLVNQHQLYADDSVTLNANHITNQLNGRISSANTQLTAKGDVHNEGLINSISPLDNAETVIKAGGRIVNTGEGRIYGDHIALQAERIENSDKNYDSGNIKSAVVAARGDLDIAAREIENNTAHYLADNQVGSTLFSIGNMHFGRTLNTDNQAEGKADALRNNSSVIEAEGNIELNINQIQNNNTHFEVEHVKTGMAPTDITKLDSRPVSETYIVPMGRNERGNLKTDFTNELNGDKSSINENDPHIPMKLLRWAGWSRAGQLVYKSDGAEPAVLKAGDVITPDTPLALRNEVDCDYIDGKESCAYTPAGQYGADSPIWAYFGATPPSTPQPKFPFDDLTEQPWFVESEWFDEDGTFKRPSRPRAFWNRERYQAQKVKWDYYVENIKPLEDWERDNADSINKVDAGIEKHNRDRLGDLADKYYRDFWRLHINNHRVDESKVTRTVAGQILAGGNIDFDSRSFTNDKSIVIAGQNIALKDQIHNIDEEGLHRITDTGDKVFTFDKWRGGFKRYFQRKWENHGPYTRIIETPFDMKLFRVDEKVNYDDKKLTSDSHKEGTAHNLSLSSLNIQDNQFSAQGDQNLGSLNGDDNAQFIGLNTSDKTQLEHWQGKGQTVSSQGVTNNFTPVRQLSRIELGNETEVRSIQPDLAIPQNVLYRVNANPNSQVLIETDPDFTNQKRWLSSDYMFNALRYEPNQMQKRIGDGFYEQRLIREQINRLTGRQFVGNYTDFDSQYRSLMDAGVTFAQKFNLRPGIALTPNQVAQLTTDIVWFENQSVRLPNGKVETVLVPKVYAMAKKGDITGNGTLLSGNKVTHKGGEFVNNGTVAGRELVQFDSESIRNTGKITGGTIVGNLSGDVENIGGTIEADRAILLNVAGNFTHRSTTHTTEVREVDYERTDTTIARKGLLHVKGEDGRLQINANNIDISGADVINDGQGSTYLSAKNQLNLTALQVGFDEKMGGGNHYRNESVNDVVISRIKGNGDVTLSAKDIYSQGADFDAKARLALMAENDIVLGSATRQTAYEEYHKTQSGNALAKKTKTTYDYISKTDHKGTELTAESILMKAGHDIQGESLLAVSRSGDIDIIGGNNVTLSSATNQLSEQHIRETKRSGFLNGGEIGFTIGSQKTRQENTLDGAIQSTARNTLGSEGGNIRIQAGNKANVSNVDVLISNEKTAVISGKNGVRVESGKDVINSTDKYEFSQSGLSIALSTPVTDAVQSAQQSVQKAKATQNEKLKGVYAVKAAEDAVIAAQNAQKVADTLSNLGNTLSENTAAAENPAVKVSVSVGTQKQERESRTTSVTHSKSNLNGGNIALISEEGKVELEGVDTQVKDTLLLDGKLGIESKGVADSYRNQTKEKNHSASVGVFVGFNGDSYGIGIEASASVGKGKENSESETWQNNQLQAGKLVTNSANGKLLLDATTVKANRWEGEVQDFEAKSRQDITKYSSEQVQAGGSVSVTYGSGGGATFNAAYNSAKLNTAQVENQTAIDIGKGGMDVKVKKNAHFDGAVMTSQAEKDDNRFQAGTLTTSDIENHSELKTRSAAMSGGSGGVNPMSALSLLGNKNESERSTTRAAIGENINIVLTNDENAEQTLNHLNRDTQNANQKVTKHDISEVKETQELVKGIGEIAEKAYQIYTHSEREKVTEAKLALGKAQAQKASKEEIGKLEANLDRLQKEFDKNYGTGSKTKRAVEAVTAALQGLAAKDVGQAAVGLASPYLNAEIKKYTEGDTQANLIAHALLGAVEAAATGNNVLAGAAAGAGSEAAADFIVKTLYKGKSTQDLTEAEKQNVTLLSQLASGLASGLIGDSTQSAAVGADIGKRAVENNFLKLAMENPDQIVQLGLLEKGEKVKKEIEEKAATEAVEKGLDIADEYLPHYVTINGELYYISVKGVINLRNGDAFLGGGVSPIALPSRGIGASASFGWAVNLERKDVLGKRVTAEKLSNDVISGTSASVSGCYYACIGYGQTISSNPKDKSYKTFEIGIGVGLKGNIPDPSGGISEEKIIKIGE
ncbi:filamentous hemagglutinin family N-terminal domain protein [Glaesserella parasuis D74]|uniref:two-partner secretion domain-containing protein n=4 Tax=Glaesserella parasuis TaxID=738 RepID=UPI0003AC3582|nr:hemagglutinin repeat-containing protein [Glaesserella parasuis]EQA10052.1 filamentous hemagglutinin family N-terminal domain protein [Glaesserella parasuis D74]